MQDMEVTLPGGLLINGTVERRARINRITGKTELAMIELEHADDLRFVSALLGHVLASIGGGEVDANAIDALCMADRQYLMLRLAAMLEGEQVWLKAICGKCGSPFDVEIMRCDLPVKEAGEGYPEAVVQLSLGKAIVRIPSAADQMAVMHLPENEAVHQLLRRCLVSIDGQSVESDRIDSLSNEDLATIDDTLDRLSPAVCSELLVSCPECQTEQQAALNHYRLSWLNPNSFFNEIHTLASHYHWSEDEILNLSRERRNRYLNLIDRSRAMAGSEA